MVSGDGGSLSHAPADTLLPFNAAFVLLLGLLTANETGSSSELNINMSKTKITKANT